MDLENIVVDITQRNYNTIQTIQYDVDSRYVNVKIVSSGKNVDLTNYMVSIACRKPDGKIVFNETEMVEPKQGLIKFLISEQISVALGEVVCELKIYGKNSSVLTTQYFTINVTQPIADKSIQSTNEFRQLTVAMNEYNKWNGKFEEKYNGLEEEYAERLTEISTQLLRIEVDAKSRGIKEDDKEFDNSTILQSIIDELNLGGGGTLFVPKGTYYIYKPLLIKSGVTIRGVGKNKTIIHKIASGTKVISDSFDFEQITDEQAKEYDAGIFIMPQANGYCIKDFKIVSDNDLKSGFGILSVSSKLSKWNSIQIENFTNGIRCIGSNWFMNVNDIRVRFADIGVSTRNSTSTTKSNTSWSVNNMFVDYCETAYEWYGLQYSCLNALACDNVTKLSYDFLYSYVSVNGLGSEKFSGTLINCNKSNVVVNGIYTLNCKESPDALFVVDSTNRDLTGLTICNADIRTEGNAILSRPYYNMLSDNAYLKLENVRGEYSLGGGIGNGCVVKEDFRGITLNKKIQAGTANINGDTTITGRLTVGDLNLNPLEAKYDEKYQNFQNVVIYSNNRVTSTDTITINKNELMKSFTFIGLNDNYIFIPLKISIKANAGGVIISDIFIKNKDAVITSAQKSISGSHTVTSVSITSDEIIIKMSASIDRPTVYFTLL